MIQPLITSILKDKEGCYWFSSDGAGFKRYNPRNGEVLHFTADSNGITNNRIVNIFQSRDGTIWVATGLKGEVFKTTSKEPVHGLTKGAFVFDEFKKTSIYQNLGKNAAHSRWVGPLAMAYAPNTGTMWAEYLFDVQNQQDTLHFPILANLGLNTKKAQFYYLESLDLSRLSTAPYLGNSGPEWFAVGMAVDKKGNIWGTYPSDGVGVYCFNPQTGHIKAYLHDPVDTNSLPSNDVIQMLMDSNGQIWTAHLHLGVSRLDPVKETFTHCFPPTEDPYAFWNSPAMLEVEKGKVWAGGFVSGSQHFITIIDINSNTTQKAPLPFTGLKLLRLFAKNEKKLAYAIDDSGIRVMDLTRPQRPIVSYSPDENAFPIAKAASMAFDKEGMLWVADFDENLLVRLDTDHQTWTSIRKKADSPVASRSVGVLGPDGRLYFSNADMTGWTELDPEALPLPPSDLSSLQLTGLYIKGERQIPGKGGPLHKPIRELEHIGLSHQSVPFGFCFSSFHFSSSRVVYHYRLYPYEENWQVLNGDPEVHYSHVPAGTYRFQVKAYTMYGLSDRKGIDLTVVLHPPWWKSWWAYTSYVVIIMGLIAGLLLYQRRRLQFQARLQIEHERAERLKELDQFKSRFYTNITHEFRTPLTVIKGMAEQISGQDKVKTLIRRNSDRLLNMVNQLLELSRLETNSLAVNWVQGDVIPYLQYLTESCHSLANNKKINLAFFSKADSLVMDYDETKLQHILVNLVSNAIKFTPEYGSVKVTA
ncbi:MAG: hypothetical protein KDD06_20240, partial [Phaeodactylibacter sp.]|nr:hypothetical protein [Phaeodactylibacter sp.]